MTVPAGVAVGGPSTAEVVREPRLVPTERAEPHRVRQHHQTPGPGDPQHLVAQPPRLRHVLGDVRRQADVDAAVGERKCEPGGPHEGAGTRFPGGARAGCRRQRGSGVRLLAVRLDADVVQPAVGERVGEEAGPAADVEQGAPGGCCAVQ